MQWTRRPLFPNIRQWRIVSTTFIEASAFSRVRERYLDDNQLRLLQAALMRQPDAGPVIKGSGGLRKLRWGAHDVGKSSGLRVIYYWHRKRSSIFLMTAYRKNELTSLTSAELRVLKALVADIERDSGDSNDGGKT